MQTSHPAGLNLIHTGFFIFKDPENNKKPRQRGGRKIFETQNNSEKLLKGIFGAADFKVHMTTGGIARGADLADLGSLQNRLAN